MHDPATLVLVDGSSYLYRAFHALPPLINSKGQATGAIYGVLAMLRKLMKTYPTPHFAVVFDAKGKTFRDDLSPEYKAHRPSMPAELRTQITALFDVVDALGIPRISIAGVEADDVMGTLAIQAAADGWNVIISTGDKDLAQLVNAQITLINSMSNHILTRETVIEKFGVPPEQIIDYLSLVGDTSDNIKGVPSVGSKTAVKWLQQYGSLEAIMAQAETIPGKVGEQLKASLSYLPLTKQLVTLKTDVPLSLTHQQIMLHEGEPERLREYYTELEFHSLLKDLSATPAPTLKTTYDLILTDADLDRWLNRLAEADLISIDTETTGLDYMQADLVGLSFAVKPGEAAYIPFKHDYLGAPAQLDRTAVLNKLCPILSDPNRPKVGHHIKYDLTILARHGLDLQGVRYDTLLECFIHGGTFRYDLDTVAALFLNYTTTPFTTIAGKGVKQLTFNQIDLARAGSYAAEDADITLRLHQHLWPTIEADPALRDAFEQIEMPLVPILAALERTGVLIDTHLLSVQSQELGIKLTALEKQAHEMAGMPFNLNSPKQLQAILYEHLHLPVLDHTPTGQPSTSEEVLQELASNYPLPAVILTSRSLSKLKSTYTDKLPAQVDKNTGRVHTSYHQVGAATGRFSSSDPNLQNIPIRTEEGRRIRQAFIAPEGYQLVAADYSQIELRIMAHLSGDKGLVDAFNAGLDIHKATAAQVFGVALDAVTSDQRRSAKAINFGLIYGMSAFGLAKQLNIERQAAQQYIDSYFHQYPGVKTFMNDIRVFAHKYGYVQTLSGRKLYLTDIHAKQIQKQKAAERAAVNAPMQGTAADIIKRAMTLTSEMIERNQFDAKMILQVHDELVFEVRTETVERFIPCLQTAMSQAASLSIPLVVDVGVGHNWDEAH